MPWEPKNIKNIIKSHIAAIRKAHHSHEQKRYALARLLEGLFGINPEEITMERRIPDGGSIDLEVGNVIFEVKVVLEKELLEAEEQLKKYIRAIYAKEGRVKTGIVTDGLKFIAYKPVIKRGRVVDLKKIGEKDIVVDTYEFDSWLRSLIFPEKRRGIGLGSSSKVPEPKIPEFKIPEPKIPEPKIPEFKIPEFKIPEPDFRALERMFGFPASSRKEGKKDKQRKRKKWKL